MAHHIEAHYDEDDSLFLPPLRSLGFNPQLTMNDSLLVQSYIERYDISYPVALRRIESEVAELRQHLETSGEYELTDIGTLRLNDEGHLEFEPCQAGILTPNLYGLSSFEMPLLKTETAEDTAAEADTDEAPESAITIKMSWLRNVAAVAAAVIAFLMIGTPISNSNMPTQVQQSAFIPLPQHQLKTDSLTAAPQEQTADSLSQPATDISENSEVSKASETSETSDASETPESAPQQSAVTETAAYCIVLASQVTERNANLFIDQLAAAHFTEARLLTGKNGMRRVVYGSYASENEAANSLRSLRNQNKNFQQAWIMKL